MSRKQQVLATIAARASTPTERLQTDYELCQESSDDAVQRRQQRLEQILGSSSYELLRLAAPESIPSVLLWE